jgi:FtsP/CotA-like multicopper oxidase with cupredoxin domain
MPVLPKGIQELFTNDYGRMNALLSYEIPNTNGTVQTTIIQAYIDPPNEIFRNSSAATPIGSPTDGTQLWKFTHNGVDTHAMHFHLFNVQLINRVGWDGAIKPPDPNELGWKETVQMNPLEDIIVALRPIAPNNHPFKLPNSVRPLDVTQPIGSTMGFTNVDPAGNPVTVTNQMTNFGWEYVDHCHLLGHEENDMMRPMCFVMPPEAPTTLTAARVGNGIRLNWANNSLN